MIKSYEEFSQYYASKCSACNGDKRVYRDSKWYRCGCQFLSSLRWRFQQAKIVPDSLKKLTWKDFDGCIRHGDSISGMVDSEVIIEARGKALKYCFGSNSIAVTKDRHKHSKIYDRLLSGNNVVIVGDNSSGKTLLATLILKEVVLYCADTADDLSFEWVNASELLHACRWDNSKTVDHDYVDDCVSADFLFVDNLDVPTDHIASINRLVGSRQVNRRPTIITCDLPFWNGCIRKASPTSYETITKRLGKQIADMMSDSENTVIML